MREEYGMGEKRLKCHLDDYLQGEVDTAKRLLSQINETMASRATVSC